MKSTIKKNFMMRLQDVEWLHQLRDSAREQIFGNATIATVVADLIDFARANGYKFKTWRDK